MQYGATYAVPRFQVCFKLQLIELTALSQVNADSHRVHYHDKLTPIDTSPPENTPVESVLGLRLLSELRLWGMGFSLPQTLHQAAGSASSHRN